MRFTFATNVLVDVLRDPAEDEAFSAFLARFPQAIHLSAIVVLELRAGARTSQQVRAVEGVIMPFERRGRVFAPSRKAYRTAGDVLARLAVREGWTSKAKPSLAWDALLASSCREAGITLVTRDRDFDRLSRYLPAWRSVTPWPES
jgi:predicted nucleic acid-binding protein